MRNRRIFHDIADRSGAMSGATDLTTSTPALVKLQASSLPKGGSRRPANAAPTVRTLMRVAELKVRVDGLPVVFVFPFEDDVGQGGPAGFDAGGSDIPSLLSNTLEKIVNRLRRSEPQAEMISKPMMSEPESAGGQSGVETVLRVGPLELNLLDRTARRGDRPIDLRPREFQLLRYMMERRDKLLTRARLFQEVWNYKFVPQTNLVDVHMGRLRRKVDGPNEAAMIRSVRGAGFVLNANPLSQN